jgi:nicotinamidase-related amidase
MTTPTQPVIDPKRTALLAMDFQNGVVGMAPEPDALLERVKDAIADVRAAGGTIGYVRVRYAPRPRWTTLATPSSDALARSSASRRSEASPMIPSQATITTTRFPSLASFASVPPVSRTSSSGWA